MNNIELCILYGQVKYSVNMPRKSENSQDMDVETKGMTLSWSRFELETI